MEGDILRLGSGLLPISTRNSVRWEIILQIEYCSFNLFTIMGYFFPMKPSSTFTFFSYKSKEVLAE